MLPFGLVPASRVASLATGRVGMPTAEEWPFIALLLLVLAIAGAAFLVSIGLTRVEAGLVAGAAPLLVMADLPLVRLTPEVWLAANVAGCLIPLAVAIKIAAQRRVPFVELYVVVGIGVVAAFLSSHVEPARGVLLQYRIPAAVVGLVAAALLHHSPERAGALAFAGGALGVLLGADVLHLRELASASGAGRVILGGAGLLDGIFLVSVLAAGIATSTATLARSALKLRRPAGAA